MRDLCLMCPRTQQVFFSGWGGCRATLPLGSPAPSGMASDCPPPMGEPVAFKLGGSGVGCSGHGIPVYPLSSGMVLMSVLCASQTMVAPGVPSQQGRWSSAMPQTRDVSREGPFDAYCSPMDTGDCPLVSTGLPGCPYRMTSYTDPTIADTDPAFGTHPRFLEFIGAPESAPAAIPLSGLLGPAHGSGACCHGRY